ncbi:hypothetical protein [Phormidesmis priestleyi]
MSNQVFEPNQFILHDRDTQIQYSIDYQTGIPKLDYQTLQVDCICHFSGDEISLVATTIGRLITVTLTSDFDQRSETLLTLLLPTVYLPVNVMEQLIQAEIITTTRRLPQPRSWRRVEGQVETHQMRSCQGIARLVEY